MQLRRLWFGWGLTIAVIAYYAMTSLYNVQASRYMAGQVDTSEAMRPLDMVYYVAAAAIFIGVPVSILDIVSGHRIRGGFGVLANVLTLPFGVMLQGFYALLTA
jgi:hypothetical protein